MKTRFLLLLVIALSIYSNAIFAQQKNISGTVKNGAEAIAAATVSLLYAKDSFWIRYTLTDNEGIFSFTGVPNDNYVLSATAIGYTSIVLPVSGEVMNIQMQKETTSLKGATVTAKKPFMEMSMGKVTVNVDASPTAAGQNVLELLRKMPGVTVDQNNSISIVGKQGVLVLIDDQPTYLSAEQLGDYLKTIPSDEVAQIELITQPSARYDAAGNAGIINIKRKKNKKDGLNGNATLTLGQGVYPFALGSAFVNYRKNKLNISISGNEHKVQGFAAWSESQYLSDPVSGTPTSLSNINSSSTEHFSIANLRLATDYERSDKETMGISINGGYHTNSSIDHINSNTYNDQINTLTYNTTTSPSGFIRKDITADAYYSYKFNNDRSLNFNLDYLTYSNSPYQDINNTSYDAQMQAEPDPLILHSYQPSLINVYSVKGDYTDTLSNGIKLETGFKCSYVTTDNNAEFNTFQNNAWIVDTTRSNRFNYKENINAFYLTASKSIDIKWQLHIGLRAENTNAQGIQQVHSETFARSYTSLFPTAYISYKKDSNNQFELNYGRRIDRPSYQSLNPFIYYSFQYSYSQGNPYLQPQYTNAIELKHSYKNMIITTLYLNTTSGIISDVLVPNNTTGIVYSTQQNIGINNSACISVLFNKDLYKWWSLNASGVVFYNTYSGVVNSTNISASSPGYLLNTTNQFNLINGWKAECGFYYSGRYLATIISTSLPSIYMDFGVVKKLNENSTLKMNIADPFYINRYRTEGNQPGLQSNATFRYSTRSVLLAYTYTFGKNQSKQRDADQTDEAKRIK